MTDRPIIMSTESIKAILDGKKTQTRRVIKPQPYQGVYDARIIEATSPSGKVIAVFHSPTEKGFIASARHCPYGQVGDRLWVRETWATEQRLDYLSPSRIGEAGDVPIWWKASSSWEMASISLNRGKWRPSIFMPRWASRITLEITEVRVERVQEITEDDARAEGIIWVTIETAPQSNVYRPCAVENFGRLWDSLNAKKYPWSSNPWVWVISFKKGQKDEYLI